MTVSHIKTFRPNDTPFIVRVTWKHNLENNSKDFPTMSAAQNYRKQHLYPMRDLDPMGKDYAE